MKTYEKKLVVLLLYTVLALIYTYPLIKSFGSRVAGLGLDTHAFLWYFWWLKNYALGDLSEIFFSTITFTPVGFYPSNALWMPLVATVNLILTSFFSQIFSYNMLVIGNIVFAGFTAYLLTLYLTKHQLSSVLAGLVFGFSSIMNVRMLNHLNLLTVGFIPLLFLYWLKYIDNKCDYKNALLVGIFWSFVMMSAYDYGLYSPVVMIVTLLLKRAESLKDLNFYRSITITLLTFMLIMAPVVFILFGSPKTDVYSFSYFSRYSADLIYFFIPAPTFNLLGTKFASIYNTSCLKDNFLWECNAYLGFMEIILLIIGLYLLRKVWEQKLYYQLFFFSALMSLGSSLTILGHKLKIILPYALLYLVPGFQFLRAPNRFNIFTILFLSIIVAQIFLYFYNKIKHKLFLKTCLFSFIFIFIFVEKISLPYPTFALENPGILRSISEDTSYKALLNLPADYTENFELHNTDQISHNKKIIFSLVHNLSLTKNSDDFIYMIERYIPTKCADDKIYFDKYKNIYELKKMLKKNMNINSMKYVLLNKKIIDTTECKQYKKFLLENYFQSDNIQEDENYILINMAGDKSN